MAGFVGGEPEDCRADSFGWEKVAVGEEIELVHEAEHVFIGGIGAGTSGEDVVEGLVAAHGGVDAGGADGVDVDVVGGEFDGQGFDKAEDAVFGGDIVGKVGHTFEASGRGDADDFAAVAGEHGWDGDFAGDPDALEIDVDGFVPLLFGHLPTCGEGVEAGVGDDDINGAERVLGLFDEFLHGREVSYVCLRSDDGTAHAFDFVGEG